MPEPVPGIHHITALARNPEVNAEFYTRLLGLRLVKQSVNQDSPYTYHLFYGDNKGTPGTTMTFFPWPDGRQGEPGTGQATVVAFAIPSGSIDYWESRLDAADVSYETGERFDETVIRFQDPDGLILELVTTGNDFNTTYWPDSPVPEEHAVKGFHGITMTLESTRATTDLLTDMGYTKEGEDGSRIRYQSTGDRATIIDLQCAPNQGAGTQGVGTVHHVAFRTKDEGTQAAWRTHLAENGFNVTPVIDRWWFHSIYFREPGGVLFEIATEEPGFTRDEAVDDLGSNLVVPGWMVDKRDEIEEHLPPFTPP